MPTSTTKTAPPAQTDEGAKAVNPDADLKEYVVTAHAVTYRTGKGRGDVARFMRGARLILHSTEQRVKELVQCGSIAPHEQGKKHVAVTAASVFRKLGAGDDPAHPPVQDVLPVKARTAKPVTPSTADNAPDE